MGKRIQKASEANARGQFSVPGNHPPTCRKPVGRRPRPCIDPEAGAEEFARFVKGVFPNLPKWFDALPDSRRQELCKYSGAHIWFQILMMFVTRAGSCNAFDLQRNTGALPANLGDLCGQRADDPRFGGTPLVTCADNATHHASRTDPEPVAAIPPHMIRQLMDRRLLESARLFQSHYVLIVDGTVHEKCRQGFAQGGKVGGLGDALYRYVLSLSILTPGGFALPFLHEAVDMRNPETDKEDCELEAFRRLVPRLKALFPRMAFCLVGDSLYAVQSIAALCTQEAWRYVFSFKEGRQPNLWEEMLALLPEQPLHRLRFHSSDPAHPAQRDFRWVDELPFGAPGQTATVVLEGEVTPEAATLYAWITNVPNLTDQRVLTLVNTTGRKRHCIEDLFNAQKNNGVGLEHVFCANANASKNYYSIMQVAEILWLLFYGGHMARLYEWARRSSQNVLARALGAGLRSVRFPPVIIPIGQLRFVT